MPQCTQLGARAQKKKIRVRKKLLLGRICLLSDQGSLHPQHCISQQQFVKLYQEMKIFDSRRGVEAAAAVTVAKQARPDTVQ